MLIVEGRIEWTGDHLLYGVTSEFTKAQLYGLLWSLQSSGLWISYTTSVTETIECLSLFSQWTMKDRHTTLLRRTKASKNIFGTRESRDWQIHVMQGFPGIGYEKAAAIVDYYGGLPLQWTGRLSDVTGVGPVLAGRLDRLLGGD